MENWKNCMAEKRGTYVPVDPAHIFVTDYSNLIFKKKKSLKATRQTLCKQDYLKWSYLSNWIQVP